MWLTNESSFLTLFTIGVWASLYGILPLYKNIVAATKFTKCLVVFAPSCQTREYGHQRESNPCHLLTHDHDDHVAQATLSHLSNI